MPPAYNNHPLVLAAGDSPVLPISLFVDGVAYSHVDTVIGYWVTNEVTQRRHLLCALRKKLLCQCGCRGWCTHFAVFSALHWGLAALAAGIFPASRHFGAEWVAGDEKRAARAGSGLTAKAACIMIKGDWSEYAGTFGMPAWNDLLRPCYQCNCHPGSMYRQDRISMVSLPWRANQDDDYYDACSRCEIIDDLAAADHRLLRGVLRPDLRDSGSHGLALSIDIPHMGLQGGDRLEPSPELPDIGAFRSLSDFPHKVTFWCRAAETLSRHRNPLLDPALGITLRSLTVDTLHTLQLGVMLEWCSACMWDLIEAKVWADFGTVEETIQGTVRVLRLELKAFYRQYKVEHQKSLTKVYLSRKTLNLTNRRLRTKAAQTWGMCLFLVSKLRSCAHMLPQGGRLLLAGEALVDLVHLWESAGRVLTPAQQQAALDLWKGHMRHTKHEERVKTPKRHLMVHLLSRSAFFGNPRWYAVWRDESLNRELKKSCRVVAQSTFEDLLLLRFRERLRRGL